MANFPRADKERWGVRDAPWTNSDGETVHAVVVGPYRVGDGLWAWVTLAELGGRLECVALRVEPLLQARLDTKTGKEEIVAPDDLRPISGTDLRFGFARLVSTARTDALSQRRFERPVLKRLRVVARAVARAQAKPGWAEIPDGETVRINDPDGDAIFAGRDGHTTWFSFRVPGARDLITMDGGALASYTDLSLPPPLPPAHGPRPGPRPRYQPADLLAAWEAYLASQSGGRNSAVRECMVERGYADPGRGGADRLIRLARGLYSGQA